MIDTYNAQAQRRVSAEAELLDDPTQISWSSSLKPKALKGATHPYKSQVRTSLYRPFTRQALYFDDVFNHRPGKNRQYFPTADTPNVGFQVISPHAQAHFSCLASDQLVDCATFVITSQFFPRWTYELGAKRGEPDGLFEEDSDRIDGYRRVDNITDTALATYRKAFGPGVTKDDIFVYVYGVLHSQQYRERFAADLKKMLPRIPLAANPEDFRVFVDAGAKLMDLHVGYEGVEPYPLEEIVTPAAGLDEYELFAVTTKRMKFASKTDKSVLLVNPHVTLRGIPDEAHEYQLGSRSALEWIIDRYYIKTDKASGIVNNPNAWSREVGDPRYIVDLVKRVTTVSVETMKIVKGLPQLPLDGA